jgi:RNase adapter protein RapZ
MPVKKQKMGADGAILTKTPVLFVTGLSGAGKSTVLNTLQDLGWETIDNFPVRLFERLFDLPTANAGNVPAMPIAIGFDSRTRGYNPDKILERIDRLSKREEFNVSLVVLDCSGAELERRYSETRRRHPLANDRPAYDGIAEERRLIQPFREQADQIIDTTNLSANDLQMLTREQFAISGQSKTSLQISSFGYSRGVPHNADLMFDMRFLRNPHWDKDLRPKTGLTPEVGAFVSADPAFEESMHRIYDMLLFLLPRYEATGKAYVNIAFGCTGGKHRSVFVAETISKRLQDAGFSPTVHHRNLSHPVLESFEVDTDGGKPSTRTKRQG